MTVTIDPRITDSISILPGPRPGWECVAVQYYADGEQDPTGTFQSGQRVMWGWARKAGTTAAGNGIPGVRFRYCFPTFTVSGQPHNGDEAKADTDARGLANFTIAPNSWDKPTNKGVYFLHPVAAGKPSGDIVGGMGMQPDHHHTDYVCVYEWNDGSVIHTCPDGQHWDEQKQACVDDKPNEQTSLQALVVKNYDAIPLAQTLILAYGTVSLSCSRQPNGDVCIVASDGGLYWETIERLFPKDAK